MRPFELVDVSTFELFLVRESVLAVQGPKMDGDALAVDFQLFGEFLPDISESDEDAPVIAGGVEVNAPVGTIPFFADLRYHRALAVLHAHRVINHAEVVVPVLMK